MDDPILQEQIHYYQARAGEYDATTIAAADQESAQAREFGALTEIMQHLTPCAQVLELACGTGIWTRHLLAIGQSILAVDASPEMIALNQAKVADTRVRYQVADLFTWEPAQAADLAFVAFWLSHVPPERLAPFLATLRRAVRPGGQLCIIDEPDTSPECPVDLAQTVTQPRTLLDGRSYHIVKVYRAPQELALACKAAGFTRITLHLGTYFFGLIAQ